MKFNMDREISNIHIQKYFGIAKFSSRKCPLSVNPEKSTQNVMCFNLNLILLFLFLFISHILEILTFKIEYSPYCKKCNSKFTQYCLVFALITRIHDDASIHSNTHAKSCVNTG